MTPGDSGRYRATCVLAIPAVAFSWRRSSRATDRLVANVSDGGPTADAITTTIVWTRAQFRSGSTTP